MSTEIGTIKSEVWLPLQAQMIYVTYLNLDGFWAAIVSKYIRSVWS